MESIFKWPKQQMLAAAIAGLFAGFSAPILSADMETLIDKLHEKGVLADDEYQEMRTEARANRREQALRDAQVEEKANKAKEENHLTGRFRDGFSWESADKRNSLALGGRVHADYRNYSGLVAADTFDIRRAYLTASGKLQDYLTFDITGDFAQTTSPQLDVAWVNVAFLDKAVQARFGQFKMPFSIEEVSSSRFLDFQERSLVNALVPQKERGAMIWGTPSTGISYGLALSTGQGKNNNEVVAAKAKNDLIGRITVNVAEILDRKDAVFHLGGAFSEGELPAVSGLTQRTEARGITFFNTAAFTGQDVKRSRLGAEAALAWGPVKLQAEYVKVNFNGASAAGADYDRDIRADYIEALWLVTGERYADAYRAGTFGRISPASNFSPGSAGWGAWEVGLRLSHYDASDFTASNPAGTGVLAAPAASAGVPSATVLANKANARSLGVKWILTPNMKFYLNHIVTKFDTPITVNPNYGGLTAFATGTEKAVTLRAAFDF